MLKHRFKQVTKKLISVTGLHNILWHFIPKGIYVFNYHRIGDKNNCAFDREVFSCTVEGFEKQCLFIKKHFHIISLDELSLLRKQGLEHDKMYALITFDDGYVDNYVDAFPILIWYNVPATFYVPTDFVGSELIPWWDEIAYILRKSQGKTYKLPNQSHEYNLNPNDIESTLSRIIYDAKRLKNNTVLDVLNDIREKFPKAFATLKSQHNELFMNWEQLKEMKSHGMKIGSHTLSHQVLSKLPIETQEKELRVSKHVIEEELSTSITSVVYPVGRMHCYTEETCSIAKLVGYEFGFNNEPGRIHSSSNSYDLNRFCVGSDDIVELKINVLFNLYSS